MRLASWLLPSWPPAASIWPSFTFSKVNQIALTPLLLAASSLYLALVLQKVNLSAQAGVLRLHIWAFPSWPRIASTWPAYTFMKVNQIPSFSSLASWFPCSWPPAAFRWPSSSSLGHLVYLVQFNLLLLQHLASSLLAASSLYLALIYLQQGKPESPAWVWAWPADPLPPGGQQPSSRPHPP